MMMDEMKKNYSVFPGNVGSCPDRCNRSCLDNTAATLLIGEADCGAARDYDHIPSGYGSTAEAAALHPKKYGNRLLHVHSNDRYRLWYDDMIVRAVHTMEEPEFFYLLHRAEYNGSMAIAPSPYREGGRDAVAKSAEWLNLPESLVDDIEQNKIGEMFKSKEAIEANRFMRRLLFRGMTR